MSDTNHVSTMSLTKLLVRAIHQRHGASCHEISRRQIEAHLSLEDYILNQLLRDRGLTISPSTDASQQEPHNPDDLRGISLDDNPDAICIIARRMKRDGFSGQNMRDTDQASLYIEMAADNPRVASELPEKGRAFWKSAEFHFRMWQTQMKRAG